MRFGNRGKKQQAFETITFDIAQKFTQRYMFPSVVSIAFTGSWNGTVRYENKKTDPNVMIMGTDENYLTTAGYELEEGRNFSNQEIKGSAMVAIIGKELRDKLYKNIDPIGMPIIIADKKYKIIGTLASKGSSMGFGGDRLTLLPVQSARSNFQRQNSSYVISIMVKDPLMLDAAMEESRSMMRNLRRLRVSQPDNFEILRSDSITQKLFENLSMVTLFAAFIAFITLLGAAIGLMNIMLVSVTERTREIGTRKALGATKSNIRNQFLIEAIVICVLGGLGGIVLGLTLGNVIGNLVGGGFIIPWNWITLGLVVCIGTGLIAGIIPANKASRLSPIEALRYE
jgi:putative ABC transport system permease protein